MSVSSERCDLVRSSRPSPASPEPGSRRASGYRALFVEAYPRAKGSQRSLALLLEHLPPEVRRSVLCFVDAQSAQLYRDSGVEVTVEPPPRSLRGYGGNLNETTSARLAALGLGAVLPFTWRLRRRFRRLAPDVVHCNQARGVLLTGWAARSLGLPIVWHLRGSNPLRGRMTRMAGRLADRVICVSDDLLADVPNPEVARTVPNAIDATAGPSAAEVEAARRSIENARAERGLEPGPTLITASSFVPHKGLHHLVAALGRLVEGELSERLLWVALGQPDTEAGRRYWTDVSERNEHRDLLRRHLFVAGWQSRPLGWLAAADVSVLPSVEAESYTYRDGRSERVLGGEGLPRTVLESMAVGTSIVAAEVPGVGDQLIDGVSGRLVPPSDPERLATALRDLLDCPSERQSLAAAASQALERFSVPAMVRGVVDVHRELLGGGSSC